MTFLEFSHSELVNCYTNSYKSVLARKTFNHSTTERVSDFSI